MGASIVIGLISGLGIGFLAVGLVLIYKANRFLNLAHAQMGTYSAVLLAKMVLDWHWSWWLAFPFAIAAGVVTGLAVERLIVRPLRRRGASTVTLLLVTVGVAQLLSSLEFIPALGPKTQTLTLQGYPLPFQSHVRVEGVILGSQYVLILVLVPLVVGALAAFLSFTTQGRMIRAAASNPDAARLAGVSIPRISMMTWGIAGALAAITAVLQAPSQPSFDASSLGPDLLLRALGAAAAGGFVSLPATLVAGLGIGLVEQLTLYWSGNGGVADLVVFIVILAIVLLRGNAIAKAFKTSGSVIVEREPVRIPAAVASKFYVRNSRGVLGLTGAALGLLFPLLPYFRPNAHRYLLALVLIYALLGVSITMVVGWAGQISLGHFALIGVGAYLTAKLSPHGLSLPLLLILAGLLGAFVMTIVSLPAIRVPGLTLAVTTLGLATVSYEWLFNQSWFGSASGYGLPVYIPGIKGVGKPQSELAIYYVALVVLAGALFLTSAVQRSLPGRMIVAVRDNEQAALAFGVTPATIKLGALAFSGFIAATGGVLWAEAWKNLTLSQFNPDLSLSILAVPVIGGLGSLSGAVTASVILYSLTFFIAPALGSLFGSAGAQLGFQLLLGGGGQVLILLAYPTGIAGVAQRLWERYLRRVASEQRAAVVVVRPGLAAVGPGALPAEDTEGSFAGVSVSATDITAVEKSSSLGASAYLGVAVDQATVDALVIDDLHLSFGGLKALDGASVRVGQGEIVGLIGANGAGKSTLLNSVSGVLPASGHISLFGADMSGLPPEVRWAYGLGRSFQDAMLFPGLTVRQVIQMALRTDDRYGFTAAMLRFPWAVKAQATIEHSAEEIIDRFGLRPWAGALISGLSTGTRRICDLAAQVAAHPRVLLLDEPTAGVAQRETEVFAPLLRRIRDELGCAIVIVEHDMPMMMKLCDRIYAMESGRVIASGTPEEVRNDRQVVASYLGSSQTAIRRSGPTGSPATNGSGGRPLSTKVATTALATKAPTPSATGTRKATRKADDE